MGLFSSTMGLFRNRAGKNREKAPAEFPIEQTETVAELPIEQTETVAELPIEQTETVAELPIEQTETVAELPIEQTETVKVPADAGPREAIREARPDPDKPGWGRTISL